MNLSKTQRQIIQDAIAQIPSEFQAAFSERVYALVGQANTDGDVRRACLDVAKKMRVL